MPSNTTIERTEGGIEVTIEPRYGETISGWEEAREDLGMNKHGTVQREVTLIDEEPVFWDEDDDYPRGYSSVTLRFADIHAVEAVRDDLFEAATERFQWGADGEAVKKFLRVLPNTLEMQEALGEA